MTINQLITIPDLEYKIDKRQIKQLYEPNLKLVRELYKQDLVKLSDVDMWFHQFSQKDTYLVFHDSEKDEYITAQAPLRGNSQHLFRLKI